LRDALGNPASLKEFIDAAALKAGQVHFDADQEINLVGAQEKKDEA
jgi:hypothetical protein